MKDKRLAYVAGALAAAVLALGCGGTGRSTTPTAASVEGEGSASKLDGPATPAPSLEFDVLTISRSGMPVVLTIEGRIRYRGLRVGSAIVTISMREAFDALAVGHTYRLVETNAP